MIKIFNHSRKSIHKAVLLSDAVNDEIKKLCEIYIGELGTSVILEMVQAKYGFAALVIASYYIGSLHATIQAHENLEKSMSIWQREN